MPEPHRMLGWLLLAAASGAAADTGSVSFAADIVPLLSERCVSCHLTGQEQGGLALHPKAAYASLVGARSRQSDLFLVEAGEPARSYLYLKLSNEHLAAGGEGERMPMGGSALEPAELEVIRRWIAEGAGRP